MHRQPLLALLRQHQPTDPAEQTMLRQTIDFVTAQPACFERLLLVGHVTGSAMLVSPDRQRVVLIHHRKLDRWFQPGGHADGQTDLVAVARREAEEETGLIALRLVTGSEGQPAVFDVDIHPIPARPTEPAHWHYDIRFLFEADPAEPLRETAETKAVAWFDLSEAERLADSESVARMLRKIREQLSVTS